MKRYIHCYCPLTYDYYLIFVMFYIKLSWNIVFLVNIESVFYGVFEHTFSASVKDIHKLWFLSTTTSADTKFLSPKPSNH